jgi:hypothetical protein
LKRSKEKEVKKLEPEIMNLTNEEITHFIGAHCKDDKCKTCLKVWKAYGRKPIRASMEENPKTKLLCRHK